MSSAEPAPFFERIVAVDGSASSRPVRGADSIWMCTVESGAAEPPVNLSTRHELGDRLLAAANQPGRTLIAVDWSLGYPAGSAEAFGLAGATPQRAMWAHLSETIVDHPDNANNRFEVAAALNARTGPPDTAGPFWGVPRTAVSTSITSTKQAFDTVDEWRLAEQRVRSTGRWLSSCWQLGGAGAVGGQSLVGIPRLAALIAGLAPKRVAVWPFHTGLAHPAPDIDVVIAEMWPSMWVTPGDVADQPHGAVRDAVQVHVMATLLHAADLDGRLAGWWVPHIPADLTATVVDEEGWILGLP